MTDMEAHALVERVTYDLCENDALCILEQQVFHPPFRVYMEGCRCKVWGVGCRMQSARTLNPKP